MKKTNRFVALMLALLMLLQTFSFAASVSDFEDFPNDWSTEAMTAAVNSGLLIGTSETTIEPKKNLTRAEMTAIVTRAFGATVPMDISFVKDVKNTDWFYSPVALSYQMGVFNGTRADLFEPKNNIRREDVFLGLSRVLVIDEGDAAVFEQFKDKDQIDSWASGALAGMIRDDYLHGYEDSTLRPRNNITRAEVAQLFHNIIDTYVSEPGEYTQDDLNGTVLVRSKDVFIHDATIDGDLIVADGVGAGNFGMQNVHVKGRILFRGGEGVVTFKNVTADGKVIINDPNGTVNFHNYRTDVPFKDNLDERTPATFLERVPDKTPGSSGPISPSSSKITYKTQFFFADLDGNYSQTADKELSQSVKKNTYVSAPIVTALSSLVTQGKLDEEVYNNWVKGFEKDPAYAAEDETTKIDVSGIVLTRHYRRKTFDVNLYKPNGTSDVEQLTFGQTLPDPATTPDGYTFEGWSITPDMNDPEFVAPGYTVDGDTTSFYPVFAPVDDNYVSKHMLENLEGTAFDIENEPADTGKANLGATVTATVREIEGFTAGTPGTGVVTEGGVLNIVTNYTRNSYTIKFLDENGDEITSSEQSVKYEGTITDVPTVTPADDENKFTGWYYDGRTYTVEEVKEITVKGEMTFTPTIIPKNYYQYYTKYELQNVEDDLYAIDELLTQTDSAEENAVVTAKQLSEVDPDLAQHFTEVATTPDASTGAVTAPDFSLVLLRRYDRKTYRVIITDKDDTPVFDDQVKYGDTVADKIPGGLPTQTPDNGKVFDGWFDQDGNEVDANYKVAGETTITPSFSDDTADYTFVTKYFFETLDPLNPYEQKLADYPDAQGSGKAATLGDAQKLADAEIPQGFVLNTEKNEKWQGTILNDNSLVLEVYYDRVIYKVTLDNGVDPRAELDVKYGDVIPAASVPAVDYDAETQDFMGWSTDGTTQGIVDLAEPVTGAMDLVPVVVDKDKEEYFYEYYFETLTDDVYSENEDYAVSDYAVVGKTLTIPELEADKTVGFTVNDAHPDAVLSGTVVKGSPLTLSKYYSRNSYEVTVNNADGSFNTTVDVKYGDTLLDKLPEVEIDPGFILDGWYDQDDSKITEETTVDENGASLVVKPVIVPDPADYDYTINYYEENLDGTYPASPKNAVTDSDKANTVITLVEGTNFTVPTGFDVDTENSVLSGTVNVDGTMTLSVYFKREVYEVTVNNVDGSFNTTVDVKYGDTLLDKLTTPEIADGYTFDGWFDQNDSQILADTTVDENGASLVVTPVLTPNDFEYTINYYEQNLDDSYPTTPSSSTSDEAPVDTVITLVEGTGFEVPTGFDVDTENSVLSGTVNANGDMTLSVYFKREVYEVTVNNADSSFNTTVDVKYGDTLLDKLPTITPEYGYEVVWKNQNDAVVDADTTVDENGNDLVVTPEFQVKEGFAEYTIDTYKQPSEGAEYPATPTKETKVEEIGKEITLVEGTDFEVPTSYELDTDKSVLSGTVSASLILKIYLKVVPTPMVTVTFYDSDGVTELTAFTKEIPVGSTIADPGSEGVTVPAGQKFVGWSTDGTEANAFNFATAVTANTELYPYFTDNDNAIYTIQYYIQNINNDNYTLAENLTQTDSTSKKIGESVTITAPEIDGLTENALHADRVVTIDVLSENQDENILKLYYNRNSYEVKFIIEGKQSGDTQTLRYGATIPTIPTAPQTGSNGAPFKGWSTDETAANIVSKIEEYTVPANNVTFTAIYSLVVMFKLDADDEDKDAFKVLNDVAVDSKITAPTADEVNKEETEVDKRRRTFLGWMLEGDDEETLVDFENYPITTDTTFVAKFEQIYITVRFYDMYARPNKRLVLEVEDTYQYGDTILLSDFPQNRDGSVYGKTYNGFWKDSTLASVYTQPYQHILNFDWFNYESTTKTWSDKFIADISDTLEPGEIQEPAATQILPPEDVLDYDLYVTAKTAILSFATDKIMADGEPLAITLPAKYNSDTRALDTFKDMLFNNKRPTLLKLEVAGIEDKLLGILADKGLLKEGTREILNVDRQINFITVLGEERLNKFLDEQFEDHYEINDEQLLEEFGAELLDNILNSDEADEKLNGIFNMPAVQSAAYKLFIDVVVPLNEAALEEKLGTDALNDIYDVAKEYVLSDNEILSAQYDSFKDVIAQDYKLEVFEKFVYPDLTGIMKEYYDGLSPAGKENFINNADVDVEDISIKNKILADKTFCEKILDDAKVRTKILSNATLKRQVLVDNESTIKPLLFSDTYRSLVIPYAKDYVADNRHSIIDDYGHLLLTDDNKEYTDAIKEDYKKEVEEALVILKKELKDEDQFCVYKDTVVIVKALKDYIEKFSFERVERDYLSKIPQKALDNLPMELIRDTYFERTRLAYLDQVNAALDKAHIGIYGEENKVDSGITINFNPISEFYIPMHDYALEKYELAQDELKDRKPEFYEKYDRYVKQNPYIDELIALAKPEKLFDGTANDYTEYSSGYSIRTVENYYDEVLLPLTVLADDAFVWYCENIPQEDLQAVLDKYEEKVLYYINFLTDLLVEYDMYGIPTDLKQLIDDVMKDDMIKNDIIKVNDKVTDKDIQEYIDKLVENKTAGDAYVKVSDKIGLRLAVILEKFAESKFNRTWDEPEYTQFQEIVEFIMEEVDANVTTDYLFDKLVKGDYKEFSKKGITVGIERQLDADVTING